MKQRCETNGTKLLNHFAGKLNPVHGRIFERCQASYSWAAYQSEWVTDIVSQGGA
ncbi:MAG: hypothetical protein LAQ69_19585 [Acidobacteriia bacterium]|nr:hypothetical protein [Terriglobia bacterium]